MKTPEASKEFIDYCIKNYCDPDSLIDTNSKSLVFMGKFEWLYYKILALKKERNELNIDNLARIHQVRELKSKLQTLKDAVKDVKINCKHSIICRAEIGENCTCGLEILKELIK